MERLTFFEGGCWRMRLNGTVYSGFPEIDRLAAYEDTGLTPEEIKAFKTLIPPPNAPLTLEELREMDGEPVWIIPMRGSGGFETWMLVDAEYELCREAHGEMAVFENCGKTWVAYRRRPEEWTK